MVLRDGIDSEHLAEYMQRLLTDDLIELDAACRRQANELCHTPSVLSSLDLAGHFYEAAVDLERASASHQTDGRRFPPGAPQRSRSIAMGRERVSPLPEIVAAMAFTAAAAFLFRPEEGGDVPLRLIASGMFGLISLAHASVAIHEVWQNAHANCGSDRY
jgi:hypothetical protein